jgi:bacterioferritin-associated ferredoxin
MMDDLPGNTERKICLCMSVTDCEIAAAFAAGHRTLNDIRATTRACTRCFGCESDLTSFIDDVLIPGKYKPPNQGLRNRAMLLARRLHLYRLAQRYYHRHVRWRTQPMVFASVVVERPNLHSRVVIANINRSDQTHEFKELDLNVQLVDQAGAMIYAQSHHVPQEGTLLLEGREMLGGRGQGLDFVGAVVVTGKRRHIGSLRPYTHYYNDRSFASTHDQWTPDVARHHGYCAMVRIPPHERLQVYVSVCNIEPSPYRSRVVLTNHRGEKLETSVEVAPYGTIMGTARDFFGHVEQFLDNKLGTLRFDNWSHRAMYYFLAHDSIRNTWNVNHL